MTTGETQTEQARLREEIELLRDQVKNDRILLPGRNTKLLFLQQPCEHYPGRIWTQGHPDFALVEQDGIAPYWGEPLGEYIGQSRCRTEDGEELACYGMFLNVIGRGKENFQQHAAAIGQLLLADAVSPGFEFIKELFEFCRLNKRLTWESNEQPGHPETRRRLAWLYDVYEAIGLFLNARLKSLEQATEPAVGGSGKPEGMPRGELRNLMENVILTMGERGITTMPNKLVGLRIAAILKPRQNYNSQLKKTLRQLRLPPYELLSPPSGHGYFLNSKGVAVYEQLKKVRVEKSLKKMKSH